MKRAIYAVAGPSGLNGAARALFRSRLLVLCYHGVCGERPDVPDPEGMHVPVEMFEDQVRFLADRYHPVGLAEVRRSVLEDTPLPPKAVLVTFDDGYRNVLQNALPVLRRYRVPTVLFAVPAAIDRGLWPQADRNHPADLAATRDGALVTWAELKALMADDLVAVGSHGLTHEPLVECDPEQLHVELTESRQRLVGELDADVDTIAYPYGAASPLVATAARAAGYRFGFTTAHRHMQKQADPLLIPRVLVGARDTRPVLSARIAGWTQWFRPFMRLA